MKETIICKEPYDFLYFNERKIITGEKYYIINKFYTVETFPRFVYVVVDKNGVVFGWLETHEIKKYFYTTKELRKLKLQSLATL